MRNTTAIAWKEINTYFSTPTAHIVGAVYLAFTGIWFVFNMTGQNPEASVNSFLVPSSWVLIFLSPLLTMRLLAEEQKMGTLELLLTAPIRDWEVVLGKYLASFVILVATVGLTLYYVIMIYKFGDPDSGPVMSAYLGILLHGGAALAIGMLASSLSGNQIVAAVVGMGTLLVLFFIDGVGFRSSGLASDVLNNMSMRFHFNDFPRGVVDLSSVVYYLSVTAAFLFLTVRSLETRRWR